jgi:hypothetical protein
VGFQGEEVMKKLTCALIALAAVSAFADEYVQGYYRRDGTYVQPYHRTTPDGNPFNNYSTQGNVNPYTGQSGTVNPYQQQPYVQPYQVPAPIQPYHAPACGYLANGQYVCR